MPALAVYSCRKMKREMRDSDLPLVREIKTWSSNPFLISKCFLISSQTFNSLMARGDIGTSRSFLPLPMILTNPSSRKRLGMRSPRSSLMRSPQLYKTSIMQWSRIPSGLLRSITDKILSISSTVSTWGSFRPILGDSRSSVGSWSNSFSKTRKR